jgi:hypothetical protein
MFICFNLRHVSAISLEIHKQDNEFVKGNGLCIITSFYPFYAVWFAGMPFNSATLIGGA